MVTFVTYFVKPPPEELERLKALYQLIHRRGYDLPSDPDEILSIMFASVKKQNPNARCCLLTDKESQFKLDPSIEIIRYPRKSYKLDAEVLRALIYYLKTAKKKDNIIFLEWDQIVQKNISHIFQVKTDLYLPYRRIPPAPFDDSFIAISSEDYEGVINFFRTILKEYRQLKSPLFRYWLGKSLILSLMFFDRMIKASKNNKRVIVFRFQNITISLLNGRKYTKKLLEHETEQFQQDASIVHFSNKKRNRMKVYWEKFVKNRSVSKVI